jgi:hypothetical protein
MVIKTATGKFDVICEQCNSKLGDYLDPQMQLPATEINANELAWFYGFDTALARCSYCV